MIFQVAEPWIALRDGGRTMRGAEVYIADPVSRLIKLLCEAPALCFRSCTIGRVDIAVDTKAAVSQAAEFVGFDER